MSTSSQSLPLDIGSLRRAYRDEVLAPADVVASVLTRISEDPTEGIWIHVRDREALIAEARTLERSYPPGARPLLYGVPFAVKDNIDVGGMPTTAACPDFAYLPRDSAPVVERLRAAGALCIGKTNLDQFATGLVGVRSPYGIPPNAFDARYVTGGSSSGSAAAVARGHVSFALGTDTAGSGRVPAAFNHLVGVKPSRGLLSTRGVVPACRSIDCVSILSFTCDDAREVASIATAFDARDPYSRPEAARFHWASSLAGGWRIGVPRAEHRSFDDDDARIAFDGACALLAEMGAHLEDVDMDPFYEAGRLLYEGGWIAERLAGLEDFLRARPASVLSVIRTILAKGEQYSATDAFRTIHRLASLRRTVEPLWNRIDALVVPTTPAFPQIDAVLGDPVESNARLGHYTTFANLLDLSAVAVPSGLRRDGLPAGVTFVGPWGHDASLLAIGSAFHARVAGPLGATSWPWPRRDPVVEDPPQETCLMLAVVGAHLSGQPLNHQLAERGAHLVRTVQTAPSYRLYALPDTHPAKPGLVRVAEGASARIEVEVWAVPLVSFGSFMAGVRSPLVIGQVELDDGTLVHGFLCEAHAVARARDISSFGGWRAYLARESGSGPST